MPVIDPAIRGNPPAVGGPTGQVTVTGATDEVAGLRMGGDLVMIGERFEFTENMGDDDSIALGSGNFCAFWPASSVGSAVLR